MNVSHQCVLVASKPKGIPHNMGNINVSREVIVPRIRPYLECCVQAWASYYVGLM